MNLTVGKVLLDRQGDYAVWGPGIDHSWKPRATQWSSRFAGLRSPSKATAITAQASQRPCLRARSGWCWFLTARPGSHDDGAIPSIRGGIEVALPIDDLAREAFATLSRGDLDWLQRQYLTQDIRCHFPGGTPRRGTYLRRWSSLTGPSSSQAAHSALRCATSPPMERHGVFISHITDASQPRPGGRHETNR